MTAASGDQRHGKAGVDVINTRDFLQRGLRAAPLFVWCVIVVHHQFLHLDEALDDWDHPKVHLWNLKQLQKKQVYTVKMVIGVGILVAC